jgi:hypothetical protein
MLIDTNVSICYSRCNNITSIINFSKSSSWCNANNNPGFDILDINVNLDILDNYGFPSIAIDQWNQPHITWQSEYVYFTNNYFKINYTTYNNTLGWHNGSANAINITPWNGYLYKSPAIDISNSGVIHVAFTNVSTSCRTVEYRQCWMISDSLNLAFWGNAGQISGEKDVILGNGTGGNMSEPSLACDTVDKGRVWVVTSELTQNNQYNIWYIMEDFQDSNYWPQIFLIENSPTYELKNPTIGFDSTATLYCIWEKRLSANDIQIYSSYNTSTIWSTPQQLTNQDKNIYPQIPKNLTSNQDQFSFIYKDDTNNNIMFHQIPEFSDITEIILIVLILNFLMIQVKRRNMFKNIRFLKSGAKSK